MWALENSPSNKRWIYFLMFGLAKEAYQPLVNTLNINGTPNKSSDFSYLFMIGFIFVISTPFELWIHLGKFLDHVQSNLIVLVMASSAKSAW